MTMPAVEEKPAAPVVETPAVEAKPEATAPATESKDSKSVDATKEATKPESVKADTDVNAEKPDTTTEETKEPSPTEKAISARLKEELTKAASALGIEGEFNTADELQVAITKAEADRRSSVTEANAQQVVEDAYSKIYKALQVKDAEGNDLFTSEELEKAVGYPLLDMVDGIRESEMQASFVELGLGLTSLLPEAAHPDFEKALEANPNINVKDWLGLAAEHLAQHTKAWKERELSHQTAIAKAEADGWEKRDKAPAGQVTQQSTQGNGKLSKEAFLAMSRTDQAKAMRDRPDEVDALS